MIIYPPAGPPTDWTVVCLCAEWCDSCCDYRRLFEQRATHAADALHLWVDIEDESDFLGGLDIETFPTLLVLHGDRPRFFGPVLPQVEVIDAMLRTMDPADASAVDIAPDDQSAVRWLAQQARLAR
jgi:hypothetical protein